MGGGGRGRESPLKLISFLKETDSVSFFWKELKNTYFEKVSMQKQVTVQ